MNVALPALVVFLCLLPGFIFRSRLKRVESTSLDYSPFGRIVSEGVLWAGVLHAVWIALCPAFGDVADLSIALKLLSSNLDVHGKALNAVATQIPRIASYFVSLYAGAYVVPSVVRWLITKYRLDRYDGDWSWLFRFNDAPWYYLLTGADFDEDDEPDFIEATAIVNVAGEPYLFKGVLDRFYFKSDGTLDRLVLENTTRRKLNEDKGPRRRRSAALADAGFSAIEGDSFVIQYDQVVTLNIQYKKIDLASAAVPMPPAASTNATEETLA